MHIQCLHTEYLNRASRTIDTLAITKGEDILQMIYVYNYEGYSYRIFENLLELLAFFENGTEPRWHFEREEEVDGWLEKQFKK